MTDFNQSKPPVYDFLLIGQTWTLGVELTFYLFAPFIVRMKLDATGDNELKDYEVAIAAVRRAEERGQLGELDREIGAILADEGR